MRAGFQGEHETHVYIEAKTIQMIVSHRVMIEIRGIKSEAADPSNVAELRGKVCIAAIPSRKRHVDLELIRRFNPEWHYRRSWTIMIRGNIHLTL
jgi:hypothetical protein